MKFLRQPIYWIIAAFLTLGVVLWITGALTSGSRAKVEARVAGNRGEAAIESGKDAVNTVGARGDTESNLDRSVSDAQSQVRNAPDAGAADTAARDGLCRISPDYCRQGTVQRPDTR